MIPDTNQDPHWSDAFAAIDAAFADCARPDHFTNHTHCCECSETDAFFQEHTPETLAQLLDPFETLPAAFLTEDAFRYLAPGILRFLARSGEHYKVGDVLFHLENRLDGLTESQLSAVLNLLHLTYDRLQAEIEATPFDGACIRRIIDAIQRATEQGASTETYPDASPRRPAL